MGVRNIWEIYGSQYDNTCASMLRFVNRFNNIIPDTVIVLTDIMSYVLFSEDNIHINPEGIKK